MTFKPEELTTIATCENIADNHGIKTGMYCRAVPIRDPATGILHIMYERMSTEGYVYNLGAVEAFTFTKEEYEGYARRQKATFPKGPIYRK